MAQYAGGNFLSDFQSVGRALRTPILPKFDNFYDMMAEAWTAPRLHWVYYRGPYEPHHLYAEPDRIIWDYGIWPSPSDSVWMVPGTEHRTGPLSVHEHVTPQMIARQWARETPMAKRFPHLYTNFIRGHDKHAK